MPAFSSAPKPIHNPNNPAIRQIRRLHERAGREQRGLVYIEGMRLVASAIEHQAQIATLIACRPLLTHPFARRLVRVQQQAGTPVLWVTPEVMHSLALAAAAQGVGAVVRQRWDALGRVKPADELCWIALDIIHAPGNLGTILRTSAAVGGAGIILLGEQVDPYAPATVRATMGAVFAQRFVRTTVAEFARWKRRRGVQLVGTSPHAPLDYHAVAYRAPTVLLMGGERQGLSPELQALCDVMVQIPMVGGGDSLNVAVATAIMLYELFNQRRETPSPPPVHPP
jgi:TrmH family RNA methyltransferase